MPERKENPSPAKLPPYPATHEKVGELEGAGAVFGRHGDLSGRREAVRMQLANRRPGTASTKTKGLVSGGGRKPWRQKGTGLHGTALPLRFVGGGNIRDARIHGRE